MATQPITPREAKAQMSPVPDAVIEAFNELIAENFDGRKAVVKQKEVVEVIEKKGIDQKTLFEKSWMTDIEKIFRAAGWKVQYESPARDQDSFDAFYSFSKK